MALAVTVFAVTSGATGGLSSVAQASTLTPDFHAPATAQPVVRSGDFDGDGRVDQLYLVTEADTGRVAVHVRLNRADGVQDIRITSLDVGGAATPNLQVVSAGTRYATDCGTYSSDCHADTLMANHDSVLLGLDGSTSVLIHWTGAKFDQDFVHSNDSLLAHAVAALYAVNP